MPKKEHLPYMPLYIGRLMKAAEIKAMPKAYRWDCLVLWCAMWDSPDQPYLVDQAGNPYTDEEIQTMLGFEENPEGFSTFWTYINRKQIFSRRSKDQALYSRFLLDIVQHRKGKQKAGKAGGKSKARPRASLYIDLWLTSSSPFREAWERFLDDRKERRKPVTSNAQYLLFLKLQKLVGQDKELAIQIVNQSTERGWSGMFPLHNDTNTRSNGGPNGQQFQRQAAGKYEHI